MKQIYYPNNTRPVEIELWISTAIEADPGLESLNQRELEDQIEEALHSLAITGTEAAQWLKENEPEGKNDWWFVDENGEPTLDNGDPVWIVDEEEFKAWFRPQNSN